MTLTYHETRGAPRRRGLDLPLTPKQREAATLLRSHLKGGRINRSELRELLWGDAPVHACAQGCDCEDCKSGKCPHTQGKGNMHLHAHARGQDDDRRQIMADLLSSDDSPFTPDDEQSLTMMSDATLRQMRDRYLKGNTAEEEIARRRNNSHVQALLVRHRDGYYVEVPAAPVHANEAEDDEAVAAMTAGHRLADELRAHAARARDLRKAKAKRAGHDAQAWNRDNSPYTPDDEAVARGDEDGEEVENHQAAIRQQASAAMATRSSKSRVRAR